MDATRGIALFGMMAVHALLDTAPDGTPSLIYSAAAGRSAATFAVLAGVGIAFMSGRAQVQPDLAGKGMAAALAARALVIGFIGLWLGYADPDIVDVILPYYGVLFLLAAPLIFLGTPALIILGIGLACLAPIISHELRYFLTSPELSNPSIQALFDHPAKLVSELLLTGYYPAIPWMTYICTGLVIGRSQLSRPKVAYSILGLGLLLAIAAELISAILLNSFGGLEAIYAAAGYNGLSADEVTEILAFGPDGTTPTASWWWLTVNAPHSSTPFDLIHTTGCAMALLGGMLVLFQAARRWGDGLVNAFLGAIAAVGSMTLTLYVGHVVFMNSPLDQFEPMDGYLVQSAAALIFASIWCANISKRGPLEAFTAGMAARAQRWVMAQPAHQHAAGPCNSDHAELR